MKGKRTMKPVLAALLSVIMMLEPLSVSIPVYAAEAAQEAVTDEVNPDAGEEAGQPEEASEEVSEEGTGEIVEETPAEDTSEGTVQEDDEDSVSEEPDAQEDAEESEDAEAVEDDATIDMEGQTFDGGISKLMAATDNIASGTVTQYGNIQWVIDAGGKLTVAGTGDFADPSKLYVMNRGPWHSYGDSIKSAVVNVTGMTNASGMFSECHNLTSVDFSRFDTSKVKSMSYMFSFCNSLQSLDLSGFDASNVISMCAMFWFCGSLKSITFPADLHTGNLTDMNRMFWGCESLTGLNLTSLDTSNVKNMSTMFRECTSLTSLNVSSFDTSHVEDMSEMFSDCGVTSLDLESFNTGKVTTMRYMFDGCENLESLKLNKNKFNTSNVEVMAYMFGNCSSLTNLDVSGFRTGKVEEMQGMFYDCSSLTGLDVSGFDTSSVFCIRDMFSGCSQLEELDLSSFDLDCVYDDDEMIVSNGMPLFTECDKLETLYTPCNCKYDILLPGLESDTWQDAEGNPADKKTIKINNESTSMSYIPAGKTYSFALKKNGTATEKNEIHLCVGTPVIGTGQSTAKAKLPGITEATDVLYSFDSATLPEGVTSWGTSTTTDEKGYFTLLSPELTYNVKGNNHYTFTVQVQSVLDSGNGIYSDPTQYTMRVTVKYGDGIASGEYGDTSWNIDNAGKFTLTGTGDYTDVSADNFYRDNIPWKRYTSHIKSAEVNLTGATNLAYMFFGCSNMTSVDLRHLDTSQVTNMDEMFRGCQSLESVDFSGFDTSKVLSVQSMFDGCSNLEYLDLSFFDLSKAWISPYFLSECSSLRLLYTPRNCRGTDIELPVNEPEPGEDPDVWYRSDGSEIAYLPANLEYSIALGKNQRPTEKDTGTKRPFVVSYNEAAVKELTLKMNGMELTPTDVKTGDMFVNSQKTYMVSVGQTLEYSISVNEHYKVGTIKYPENREEVSIYCSNMSYKGSMKLEKDSYLTFVPTVESYYEFSRIVRKGASVTELPITLGGGSTYALIPGYDYALRMYYGAYNVSLNVDYRGTYVGRGLQVNKDDGLNAVRLYVEPNNTRVKPGRTISMSVSGTLYSSDGSVRKRYSKPVRMQVGSDIKKVNIKRYTEDVWVDTVNRFAITGEDKNDSVAGIGVKVDYEPGCEGYITDWVWRPAGKRGILRVSVAANAHSGKIATIRLYRTYEEPESENYYISAENNGVLEIKVGEPKEFKEAAPEVSCVGADDVSLTLALKGLENYARNIEGAKYYKVVVTPKAKDGEAIPASIREAVKDPIYIQQVFEEDLEADTSEEAEEDPDFPDYSDETEVSDDTGDEDEGGETEEEVFVQTAKIPVNSAAYGNGAAWDYDVSVTMVWAKDKTELSAANEAAQTRFASKTSDAQTFQTKKSIHATKVSLKKLSTKIYTRQKAVEAAQISFDKNAVLNEVEVKDITSCAEAEKLRVSVKDNKLVVDAPKQTALGKHTIEVTACGSATIYRPSARMDITVQQSITELELNVPSQKVYKKSNGAASLSATVTYNPGGIAPATKKVTWSIVSEDGGEVGEEFAKVVSINNSGKVSIKKTWNSDDYSTRFCIMAKAADFTGNAVKIMSTPITISESPIVPAKIVIVKRNPDTQNYEVVAKDGDSVTTDQLKNTTLLALQDAADSEPASTAAAGSETEVYTEEQLEDILLSPKNFTVKSSNKAVKLTKTGSTVQVAVSKPANNVKLTVTMSDGGKKSASMKFSIKYKEPEEMDFQVFKGSSLAEGDRLADVTDSKEEVPFKGTVNSILTVRAMQKNNDVWSTLDAYINHSVGIKGGKVIASDVEQGLYKVVVTGEKATVTLTDKAKKQSKTCTLVNKAYSGAKAPSIKVKASSNGSGSSIKAGAEEGRYVEYQIPDGYPYVMVETDATVKAKNEAAYTVFEAAGDKIGTRVQVEGGLLRLSFDNSNIAAKKYNMIFTLGKLDEQNEFVATVKPVKVTVNVAKPKINKGYYKPTTSYKIDATPGAKVVLGGKESYVKNPAIYVNILAANVKGEENGFLNYFELKQEDGKSVIAVKESLTDEQIAALKANKADRVGYVTYMVAYGDDGYGNPVTSETKTVKITMNLKK